MAVRKKTAPEQRARQATKAMMDFAMLHKLAPVAGDLSDELALRGIEAIEAWCKSAKLQIQENTPSRTTVKTQLREISVLLGGDRRHYLDTDLAYGVGHFLLATASTTDGMIAESMVLSHAIEKGFSIAGLEHQHPFVLLQTIENEPTMFSGIQELVIDPRAVRVALRLAARGFSAKALWALLNGSAGLDEQKKHGEKTEPQRLKENFNRWLGARKGQR